MSSYIFAVAFYLLASSIMVAFFALNQALAKALRIEFNITMLMLIYLVGTSFAFIVSQTFFFSNVLGWVAPYEELYPAHLGRVLSLTMLGICTSCAIVYYTYETIWKWLIGGLLIMSVIMYFTQPYIGQF